MSWQKPLRPISNAWENSKLPAFLGKFQELKLPTLYKGENGLNYASVIYVFEKVCLHLI